MGKPLVAFEFRAFGGSRPLSDRQIAAAILKSATFSLFVSAAIWAVCIALFVSTLCFRQGSFRPLNPTGQIDFVQFVAGKTLVALIVWCIVGVVTSLALAGRRVMRIALGLAFVAWMTGMMLQQLPYLLRTTLTPIFFEGCFALCLVGCGAAFLIARRRNLISARALWLAAAIVLLAFGGIFFADQTNLGDRAGSAIRPRCLLVDSDPVRRRTVGGLRQSPSLSVRRRWLGATGLASRAGCVRDAPLPLIGIAGMVLTTHEAMHPRR